MSIVLKDETAASVPTPSSGKATVFSDGGALKLKDSSGTTTTFGAGSVATDSIWDAAGDLVVGTGANTAAKLSIGSSGTILTSNGTTASWAALDSDLTTIAGLSPSNDDLLQRKSGAWTNRTIAQVKADMGHLGTYTWADLQTAYPNGGGALAALATGTVAFVSDWGAFFTPNAAKTAWIPTAPITLFSASADSASVLNTVTTFLENFTVTVPTGLLVPGNLVTATLRTNRTAGSVNYRPAIQVGATRLALATSSGMGAKFFGQAALMCRAADQLSGQADAAGAMGVGTYTGSSLASATVNSSNPLRFGVDLFAAADSTTTVVYEYCVVQMAPGV